VLCSDPARHGLRADQSIDALTTTYGIVWMIALLTTLGLAFTGRA
jgi:hypothetical protein